MNKPASAYTDIGMGGWEGRRVFLKNTDAYRDNYDRIFRGGGSADDDLPDEDEPQETKPSDSETADNPPLQKAIFVFGSNTQGRHGKGTALWASRHHGAKYGQAEGLQGNSYAIITKELRAGYPAVSLEDIKDGINRFLSYAESRSDLTFMVAPIGCGLAGFTPQQIAPFFKVCPPNVSIPTVFKTELDKQQP